MEIRCPKCGGELVPRGNVMLCFRCNLGYLTSQGVPFPQLAESALYPKRRRTSWVAVLALLAVIAGCGYVTFSLSNGTAAWGAGYGPRATATRWPRPLSYQYPLPGGNHGLGTLTVENGGSQDGFVRLSTDASTLAVAAGYVRSDDTLELTGIPDGTYRLFYCTGQNWRSNPPGFMKNQSCRRFVDALSYTTTHGYTRVEWSTWTVSLHAVPSGTAETARIDAADLPPLR